jgi:hypothetical protein
MEGEKDDFNEIAKSIWDKEPKMASLKKLSCATLEVLKEM